MRTIYLAVFGDIHGNLDDMYEYVRRWERKHGTQINAILQTGDMGVFPPGSVLDKATKRFAEKDPTELGCADYIVGRKKASHLTLFVRGNHEDFDFLSSAGYTHIDPYGMIQHLSSGRVFTLQDEKETVHVSGLGGIVWGSRRWDDTDLGHKFFTDEEIDLLLRLEPGSVAILLFHEAPKGYGFVNAPYTGADEVTLVIEYLQPRFAFYGHYEHPPEPFHIGRTLCVGMNNPNALRLPRRDGAMGIVDTSNWNFEFVMRGGI